MATPGGLVDKQELINAQLDTAHLGRVVNSKDSTGAPITTSTNRTGGVNKTLDGLEGEYQAQIDTLEARTDTAITDAEAEFATQRDQFDATFQAQFAYKRIGNISDYAGQQLQEADKLNSYQYPDDSGEWYGPVQSQIFPITIPTDPSASSDWALVNALTSDTLSAFTDVLYKPSGNNSAFDNMLLESPLSAAIGDICKTGGTTFRKESESTPLTPENFRAFNVISALDFCKGDKIADDAEGLEKAYAVAILNKCDLFFHGEFRVARPLIFNAANPDGSFNQNTRLVGTGKWLSGIYYDGTAVDSVITVSNTSAVSRVNGFGVIDMYIDCNNKADTSIKNPSIVDPWFSDFTFERSIFKNATVSNLKFQGYVGSVRKNQFLGNADVGFEIQGPLTSGGNTSTIIEGNWATGGVKKGYKVENLVYSSFRNNACDGQSVELAYELSNFNGTFESNGAEQTQRYASFDKCVVDIVSPFPGFMGLDGGNVDNIIELKGRTKATFSNFQEPDQWLKPGNTATNLIYIDPANQDGCDITVLDGTVRPEHVYVEYANLSPSARNPRCINFPFLRDTFAHYGGGFASGGEVSAEFTGVDFQRFGRPYNPVSRNSMSFYTSAAGTKKTISNFDVVSSDAGQQCAMYVVKVTGTRRYVNIGEVFSYQFNVTYADDVKSTSNTALIPCTAGVPCSVDIGAGGNLELTTVVTDTLWEIETKAVAAIGKMSSSATIGLTNPFIIDVQ